MCQKSLILWTWQNTSRFYLWTFERNMG